MIMLAMMMSEYVKKVTYLTYCISTAATPSARYLAVYGFAIRLCL
jgi:hypothetical protein